MLSQWSFFWFYLVACTLFIKIILRHLIKWHLIVWSNRIEPTAKPSHCVYRNESENSRLSQSENDSFPKCWFQLQSEANPIGWAPLSMTGCQCVPNHFSRRDNCTYIFRSVECLRVCARAHACDGVCVHVWYACLAAYVSKYITIHMYLGWYVERHLIEIFQLTQIFISLNSTENIFMFHFESELNGTTKKGTDGTRTHSAQHSTQ